MRACLDKALTTNFAAAESVYASIDRLSTTVLEPQSVSDAQLMPPPRLPGRRRKRISPLKSASRSPSRKKVRAIAPKGEPQAATTRRSSRVTTRKATAARLHQQVESELEPKVSQQKLTRSSLAPSSAVVASPTPVSSEVDGSLQEDERTPTRPSKRSDASSDAGSFHTPREQVGDGNDGTTISTSPDLTKNRSSASPTIEKEHVGLTVPSHLPSTVPSCSQSPNFGDAKGNRDDHHRSKDQAEEQPPSTAEATDDEGENEEKDRDSVPRAVQSHGDGNVTLASPQNSIESKERVEGGRSRIDVAHGESGDVPCESADTDPSSSSDETPVIRKSRRRKRKVAETLDDRISSEEKSPHSVASAECEEGASPTANDVEGRQETDSLDDGPELSNLSSEIPRKRSRLQDVNGKLGHPSISESLNLLSKLRNPSETRANQQIDSGRSGTVAQRFETGGKSMDASTHQSDRRTGEQNPKVGLSNDESDDGQRGLTTVAAEDARSNGLLEDSGVPRGREHTMTQFSKENCHSPETPFEPERVLHEAAERAEDQIRTLRQGQSSRVPRFVVDENGRIGNTGIGVLSQIVSTPSVPNDDMPVYRGNAGELGGKRTTRLHKPTTNIYSAAKKQSTSVLKARSSKATSILRTPGARTPVHATSKKRSVAWEDIRRDFRAPKPGVSTSDLGQDGNNDQTSRDAIESSVLKSLQSLPTLQSADDEKENMPTLARGKHDLLPQSRNNLVSSESEKSPGSSMRESAISSPKEEPKGFASVTPENSLEEPSSHQPQTAPGPGPRARIEQKRVKSALRCRIETLRAAKTASRIVGADSREPASISPPEDSLLKTSESEGAGAGAHVVAQGTEVPLPRSSSLGSQGEPSEKGYVHSAVGSPETEDEVFGSNSHVDVDSRPSGSDAGDSERMAMIDRASQCSTPYSEVDGNGDNADGKKSSCRRSSEAVLRTEEVAPLSPKRSTPQNKSVAIPSKILEAEALHPVAENFTAVADQSIGRSMETPIQSSPETAEDEAPQSSSFLPNLVSSVSSFLPGASRFLSTKVEERTAGDEAKLELKRQEQDAERREAELLARREAQRRVKQKEAQDKQKRAEQRRRMMDEAAKHREDERRRKDELRAKKRVEDEERRRKEKEEEDRKKEERRRRVLEQKRLLVKGKEINAGRSKAQPGGTSKLKPFRPGHAHSRLPPSGMGVSKIPKYVTADKTGSSALKTPTVHRAPRPEEANSYELTAERRRGDSETSEEMNARRRKKLVPSWAGKEQLLGSLQSQTADPDMVFARVHTCDLEVVFSKDGEAKKYKPRSSSGNWAKDRVTAKEELDFKKKQGYLNLEK